MSKIANRTVVSLLSAAALAGSLFLSAPATGGVFTPPWDKLAHLGFFGTLGLLLCAGFGPRRLVWAFILTIATGAADELYQSFLPTRQADWGDLLTDVIAAALAVWLARFWFTRRAAMPKDVT